MLQEYEQAWLYSDQARQHGHDARDTGIDAVAKIRETGGYCAIQCEFYRPGYRIQKMDADSFLSASQIRHFETGMVIETTGMPWSFNANAALTNIPLEAYDYIVNGKSAIDRVMERQCVITVSLESMKIVRNLPKLEIDG